MAILKRTAVSGLSVQYEGEKFPASHPINGHGALPVSWDDVVWSALTIGRPNVHHVFSHGVASTYEAIFRISLVRMALEQSGPRGRVLRRTSAFKSLDPTEKGAVNYFLGMVICKLFAAQKLSTPWLLHLDLFKNQVGLGSLGRSRPDFIGQETGTGHWHAFESKGRASVPGSVEKQKAKDQANRVLTVNSVKAKLHIGAITHFRGDSLHFYWCDPPPDPSDGERGIEIAVSGSDWEAYYGPVVELVFGREEIKAPGVVVVDELDLTIEIHPKLLPSLRERAWGDAKARAFELAGLFASERYNADGLRLTCGQSWKMPLERERS